MNMLKSIIGQAKTGAFMKKMRGGPGSLLPLSPLKGTGVKRGGGLFPKQQKNFVVSKQNPAFTPKTGGLVSPWRMK